MRIGIKSGPNFSGGGLIIVVQGYLGNWIWGLTYSQDNTFVLFEAKHFRQDHVLQNGLVCGTLIDSTPNSFSSQRIMT